MQIITTAIQRGGTGKTSTATALAQAAAHRGYKALAIDLDPQGNLSFAMGANMNCAGSYDLIAGTKPAAQLIQQTESGVSIIPASWNLATLTTEQGSARRLQTALQPLAGRFDLIVIDTPPTAGELQYNALQASTGLIIPLQADTFCLQGLYQIADTARQIQRSNPALKITGILFTNHNDRATVRKQLKKTIEAQAAEMGIPSLGAIRQGVAIQEAQTLQQSLFQYAPKSKPAADYLQLLECLELDKT